MALTSEIPLVQAALLTCTNPFTPNVLSYYFIPPVFLPWLMPLLCILYFTNKIKATEGSPAPALCVLSPTGDERTERSVSPAQAVPCMVHNSSCHVKLSSLFVIIFPLFVGSFLKTNHHGGISEHGIVAKSSISGTGISGFPSQLCCLLVRRHRTKMGSPHMSGWPISKMRRANTAFLAGLSRGVHELIDKEPRTVPSASAVLDIILVSGLLFLL